MAALLASEYKAWWIGGTSSSFSGNNYILCTKYRAVNVYGCTIMRNAGYYNSDSQLVRVADLGHVIRTYNTGSYCSSDCGCQGNCGCWNNVSGCSCQGHCGSIANAGCWCYVQHSCDVYGKYCDSLCVCHGGNFTCSCNGPKGGSCSCVNRDCSCDGNSHWSCSCNNDCTCNAKCDRDCDYESNNLCAPY